MEDNNKQYPEGYFVRKWMAIYIAIFAGVGIPLSAATGNEGLIGIGPALGVSIGAAVGSAIEAKYKKQGKIRPMTEAERKRKKLALTIGLILLTLSFLLAVYLFLK